MSLPPTDSEKFLIQITELINQWIWSAFLFRINNGSDHKKSAAPKEPLFFMVYFFAHLLFRYHIRPARITTIAII